MTGSMRKYCGTELKESTVLTVRIMRGIGSRCASTTSPCLTDPTDSEGELGKVTLKHLLFSSVHHNHSHLLSSNYLHPLGYIFRTRHIHFHCYANDTSPFSTKPEFILPPSSLKSCGSMTVFHQIKAIFLKF